MIAPSGNVEDVLQMGEKIKHVETKEFHTGHFSAYLEEFAEVSRLEAVFFEKHLKK